MPFKSGFYIFINKISGREISCLGCLYEVKTKWVMYLPSLSLRLQGKWKCASDWAVTTVDRKAHCSILLPRHKNPALRSWRDVGLLQRKLFNAVSQWEWRCYFGGPAHSWNGLSIFHNVSAFRKRWNLNRLTVLLYSTFCSLLSPRELTSSLSTKLSVLQQVFMWPPFTSSEKSA